MLKPRSRPLSRPFVRSTLVSVAVLAVALVAVGILARTTSVQTAPVATGAPQFVDETASAGIDHIYTGDFDYAVGGGVAAFDCTGGGRPSLYFAGGSEPAALYRNDSTVGGPLRFTRLERVAGLEQ